MRHAAWPLVLALFLPAPRVHASSVVPLSFEDLVGEARSIVRAQVVDVRSGPLATGPGGIETIVTFRIDRVLKGTPERALVSLRFLGGSLGDEALEVAGMPRFAVGDRDVLCLGEEAGVISPIVGLMQGRFRVVRGTDGEDRVTLHDGTAFATTAQVARPVRESLVPVRTMSLSQFEAEVSRVLAASGAGRRQP